MNHHHHRDHRITCPNNLRILLLIGSLLVVAQWVPGVSCHDPTMDTTATSTTTTTTTTHQLMMDKIRHGHGFLAALDQSGGSTLKALERYGYPIKELSSSTTSTTTNDDPTQKMFDAVHEMRTRIMTSPSFDGHRILGAILFWDTAMKRTIDNHVSTPEYLWTQKQIVSFLKVDQGLLPTENGVQLMKPMPHLDEWLQQAKALGYIGGTKMRSVIQEPNPTGIQAVVKQQFEFAKRIVNAGLVPIIEPEIDIHSPDKQKCEELLKKQLLQHLDDMDQPVILKVSLPLTENFYQECINHPCCLRMVALSGGYSRREANGWLSRQSKMIASFSRALTEGLTYDMSPTEFDRVLDEAIASIYAASIV